MLNSSCILILRLEYKILLKSHVMHAIKYENDKLNSSKMRYGLNMAPTSMAYSFLKGPI